MMIELKSVRKEYKNGKNRFLALKDINLSFDDKGMVVILGKSGSGKSTLLNLLGALDVVTSGEIIVDGKSFNEFKTNDYDNYRNNYIGFVFQEFNLINEISINENVELALKLKNFKDKTTKVDDILTLVGLNNIGHKKCSELSGGQRQRVAIARALVKNPKLILADEPTGALDSNTSIEIFELFKNIAKDKLVIVVTHNEELAYGYADRIISISDGTIVNDVTRNKQKSIKQIASNVLEVDSGYTLTKEDLDSIFKENSYIGISTNLHDLTLAYDEIDDYKDEIKDNFSTTKRITKKSNEEFNDTSNSLSYKDAYKIAKDNMKNHNKKYRYLKGIFTFFSLFFIVAFTISTISINSFVSKQTTNKDSLNLLEVSHLVSKTKVSELDDISDILNNNNYAYMNEYIMTPYYGDDIENCKFVSENFNGIIEGENTRNLNLELIYGNSDFKNYYQIVISDYMAYNFSKFGVLVDNNGLLEIMYPSKTSDLINKKIKIEETDKEYEIIGIYKTNFYDLLSDYNNGYDVSYLIDNNIKFLYSKIYAKIDFYKQYKIDYKEYSFYEENQVFLVNLVNDKESKGFYFSDTRLEMNKDKLDKDVKYYGLDGNEKELPLYLNDNEIIISIDHLYEMFYEENKSLEIMLKQTEVFNYLNSSNLKIDLFQNNNYSTSTNEDVNIIKNMNIKIVGILDKGNRLFVASNIYDSLEYYLDGYDSVYFYNEDSSNLLNKNINKLQKHDSSLVVGNNIVNIVNTKNLNEVIEGLSSIFIIVTLVLLIFSFIICMNYMSIVTKSRNKELTIYRTLGAKKRDIYKIFVFESINICAKSVIGAIVGSYIVIYILNNVLSSISFIELNNISILSFNLIYCLLALISVFTVCLITSYLNTKSILNKKLVDAFKVN